MGLLNIKAQYSHATAGPRVRVDGWVLPRKFEIVGAPTEGDDQPSVRVVWEVLNDGTPECSEFHMVRSEGGREIRRSDLQGIRMEDWLEWAAQSVVAPDPDWDGDVSVEIDPRTGLRPGFLKFLRKARRREMQRGPSDDQLREAAEICGSGTHAPTQAVADRFGIGHRTASLWIRRAKDRGYIK
jgi:hypothetical protein